MFTRSISRTDAAPIPNASARSRIFTARRCRWSARSSFESSTPGIARTSGGMMTAQATTGPARGPRPTSSIPAISGPAVLRSSRSIGFHRSRATALLALLGCGGARLGNSDAHLLFANARGFAREVAQVVQLRATNASAAHHVDLGEHGAVEREDALDADAVGDLADRKRLADSAAAARDADALERLNALLFTFLDADAHTKRVAGAEGGDVTEPLFLGFDEGMHMTLAGLGWPGRDVVWYRLGIVKCCGTEI